MSLKEQEPRTPEYVRVEGSQNIPTSLGLISIDVNTQFLRKELIQSVMQQHQNSDVQQRGRDMSQKVVIVFNGQALIDFLIPQIEKKQQAIADPHSFLYRYLGAERENTLKTSEQIRGRFMLNPVAEDESIFLLNVPLLAKDKDTHTFSDFQEELRHAWLHERHHFVQSAQPGFSMLAYRDRELMNMAWILAMGGALVAGGVVGYETARATGDRIEYVQSDISRRDFLRLGGCVGGAALGSVGGLFGIERGIRYLNYHAQFTVEGQAEAIARNSDYSVKDLQKTFTITIDQ